MTNMVFIAPPAAGKGTQADLLKQKYNFEHISTGDLLREVVASGSDFGKQISEIINRGELVSDDIVLSLLRTKLESLQGASGVVFDGFPRTLQQAELLENLLISLNQKVDYVIYLKIDRDMAMRRALGRITCSKCGAIYDIYNGKFDKEGFCNKCGGELEKRNDDNEETFKKRFDSYIEKTAPLIEYYQNKGLLYNVSCCEAREDTFKQIENIINKEN